MLRCEGAIWWEDGSRQRKQQEHSLGQEGGWHVRKLDEGHCVCSVESKWGTCWGQGSREGDSEPGTTLKVSGMYAFI